MGWGREGRGGAGPLLQQRHLRCCLLSWWAQRQAPAALCRVISRAPGLKLVVETLISSLRPIGNIVLICCAFFIIFGILGVQVGGPACPWVSRSRDCGLWSVISSRVAAPGRPSLAPRPSAPGSPVWGAGGQGV